MLEFLKIAFVLVTAPLWLPFLRAMLREVEYLFEEDGGLFGEDPGPIRREAIRARRESEPSVLVHEWLAHVRAGGGQSPNPARPASPGASAAQPRRVEPALGHGQRPARRPSQGDASGPQRPSFRR